jgi:hypothetical protein
MAGRRGLDLLARVPMALWGALLARAERAELLADVGRRAARLWLWRQVLGSVPALLGWSWWRERSGFELRVDAFRA